MAFFLGTKVLKMLIAPISALLVFLVLVGLASAYLPGFNVPLLPELSISRRKNASESQILLREVRPVFSLTTVEYTYKSVFPYDYFPPDTDYTQLRALEFSDKEVPVELEEEMELFRLCIDLGLEVGKGAYDFVVITTRVKAGYDLSGSGWAENGSRDFESDPSGKSARTTASAGSEKEKEEIPISTKTGRESGTSIVTITLPEPIITDFIIRDETSERYEYPDIELTAAEWKKATEYVREKIHSRVMEEGILQRAEERARELIRRLLTEAGRDEVRFETP